MAPKLIPFGLVAAWSLALASPLFAQAGGLGGAFEQGSAQDEQVVTPTGPAAKKADDLIKNYTARIEKEIEQNRKEVERLRTELHELIDIRYEMADAIAGLRGELAAKGSYSPDSGIYGRAAAQDKKASDAPAQAPAMGTGRDLFYGLGSALPKDPTPQQREQLRRLAPRADLKRMIERLRTEVEDTRAEVDRLAYRLLELRAGHRVSYQAFGGMGGFGGGAMGPWFGSIGMQGMAGMR